MPQLCAFALQVIHFSLLDVFAVFFSSKMWCVTRMAEPHARAGDRGSSFWTNRGDFPHKHSERRGIS